jgi:hypothetical protein
MPVESDFFHDHKMQHFFCHFLNFELIAVSVIKSLLSAAAYPLLCPELLFFNVNKSK